MDAKGYSDEKLHIFVIFIKLDFLKAMKFYIVDPFYWRCAKIHVVKSYKFVYAIVRDDKIL